MIEAIGKKKILFISNPMQCGGIEKALLSVMSVMDYEKYDVYFMPYIVGDFEWDSMIPPEVHKIDPPKYLRWHMMYRRDVFLYIIRHLNTPNMIVSYLKALLAGKRAGFMDVGRQWFWVWNQNRYSGYEADGHDNHDNQDGFDIDEFDVAIDFRGEVGCYYMVDKIKAKRKYSWYHGDYRNYPRNQSVDEQYWSKLDGMVTIGEELKDVLEDEFDFLKNRVTVIPNLLIREKMMDMAGAGGKRLKQAATYILSVGRFTSEKGYDRAIDACSELKKRGYSIEWHLVGDGPLRMELKQQVNRLGLGEEFIFDGKVNNPYPFYKTADIYVHTSTMEGRPITMDEAKLFCLPIVSTHFPTVVNQIKNGVNGTITDFEPEHIADAIEEMITKRAIRHRYESYLETHIPDNSEYILRLNELLER